MPPKRVHPAALRSRASHRNPDSNDLSTRKTGSADKMSTLAEKIAIAPRHLPGQPPQCNSPLRAQKSSWIARHLPLLHLIDPREVVLEIINAEEKRHHAVQGQTDGLGRIEMIFDGASHVECGYQPHDSTAQPKDQEHRLTPRPCYALNSCKER